MRRVVSGRGSGRRLVVEADGGSRGNPGVAGYGALVRDADTGRVLVELAEPLGRQSNNVAEYTGLLAGLRAAAQLADGPRVVARLDSKLVVEQMSGRWKIKHEDMRRLALEAREVCSAIRAAGGSVEFEWVPRERNKAADALSNDAMDGRSVHRVHEESDASGGVGADASGVEPDASPRVRPPAGVEPLRLLLVQVPHDVAVAPRVAGAVSRLVGDGARLVASDEGAAADVVDAVASALGVEAERTPAWSGTAPGEGVDEEVRAAYLDLVGRGGTVVAVTSRRGVLSVLADVLGVPGERFWALATAPGSLSAVEAWDDGSTSVAFTNRTDHLA